MSDKQNDKQNSKQKKHRMRKILISLSIAILITLVIAVGAYAALRIAIRPPEIPEYVEVLIPRTPSPPAEVATEPEAQPEANHEGNVSYEYKEEETYLPYVPIPEFETLIFQRKPSFFTFLIYGLDDGNNVDALLVAAFDAVNNSIYLISIPRDTRVYTDRTVTRKVVASYSAGRRGGGGHEGGIDRLKTEVSTLIGFRPDLYIGVNQRGFVRLVDAIGGIEVDIPFRMVYNDPHQNLHINLSPGQQVLNGQQALNFARFRQFDQGSRYARSFSDFQRVANHQQILSAIMQELLSARTIIRLPELASNYRDNVSTNLSTFQIAWFVEQASRLDTDMLSTYTLPIARTVRQGWYELPDAEATLELINRTINPFTRDILPEMLRIIE